MAKEAPNLVQPRASDPVYSPWRTRASLPAGPLRVLIVEDEPAQMKLFSQMILSLYPKARVYHADNSREVERILSARQPTLLLLDLNLPDVNGFQICATIDKNADLREKVRILAMSGLQGSRVRSAILAAGADDFIKKPFLCDEFAEAVRHLLATL